ncbi:MAG: sensor histidine kinase [Spirochaetota bacterium]
MNRRIKWLLNLRWMAAGGVFLVTGAARYVLHLELEYLFLYCGGVVLVMCNTLYSIHHSRLELISDIDTWFDRANVFANVQISVDLVLLVYLVYFSGNLENPFLFYFVFHMVIASILLSNRAAYFQATLAILLLGIVSAGEIKGILPHYHLEGFVSSAIHSPPHTYQQGILFAFSTTVYITVYFATTIVNRLREHEENLAIANTRLKEMDRIKSQYVQRVSHDIQAPLSTIQNCLKVVLSGFTGPVSEKSLEMIARGENKARNVLYFVKDLLNLSRMRAAETIHKKQLQFHSILQTVAQQLNPEIEKKKIELSLPPEQEIYITGDPEGIKELLVNILENAVKYTPEHGRISVSSQDHETGKYLQVAISDTGIGIPQQNLPHIFEDFYRAPNAKSKQEEGTGLGLSIAKHIVEAHGGKISAESSPAGGTTISFTLPKQNYKEAQND